MDLFIFSSVLQHLKNDLLVRSYTTCLLAKSNLKQIDLGRDREREVEIA